MSVNIVFLDEYTVNHTDLSRIKGLGNYTGYENSDNDQIIERCKDADIVITNKMPFKADTISALPNLKLICIAATGMNNVDLDAAKEAGITVKNAVDYSTNSVAEMTFCGVLALYRQIMYYDDYVKSGAYINAPRLFDFGRPTYELYGKKWGIIGLGNIGARVAEIAKVFGCEVSYYSTSGRNNNSSYPKKDLSALLSESDIISVHAPLSKDTYHLLGKEQFEQMKSEAIVVNMARGSLIDEQALTDALNNSKIAGAALDVYSYEPMAADNPVMNVKDKYKLVMSPHTAWSTKEALCKVVERVADNIEAFLADQK